MPPPTYLITYLITYLHTYIPTYLHSYIPTFLHTYIPTYLHTYIPTYLHTYIPTYLHTYIPTYLHTYIPTYLHTYIPTYLHTIPYHTISLHYITLQYSTLHYITLYYIDTLHRYITLHYITLHYITLHDITLHYITLHYITYIRNDNWNHNWVTSSGTQTVARWKSAISLDDFPSYKPPWIVRGFSSPTFDYRRAIILSQLYMGSFLNHPAKLGVAPWRAGNPQYIPKLIYVWVMWMNPLLTCRQVGYATGFGWSGFDQNESRPASQVLRLCGDP